MLLSIIIIEYHSREDVNHCVSLLKSRVRVPIEIIVSSNSRYSDQERREISETAGDVRWLFNEYNGGFAYAMNCGLDVATGDLMVIMNPDCVVCTDLSGMVDFLQEHPEVGAISPRVCDADGELQDTARPYVTIPRILNRFYKLIKIRKDSILEDEMDYDKVQTVDWVVGAFVMVTRKAYELTGGLDTRFFMYAEDLDWCTRIRQKGLEIVYYPKDKVIFKGTRRARKDIRFAIIFFKSHLLYWYKSGFFGGQPKRKELEFE